VFSFPTLCPWPLLALVPGILIAIYNNVGITRTTDATLNHPFSIAVVHSINEWLPRRLGATSAILAGVRVCGGTKEAWNDQWPTLGSLVSSDIRFYRSGDLHCRLDLSPHCRQQPGVRLHNITFFTF
jgi:hypothetical protein